MKNDDVLSLHTPEATAVLKRMGLPRTEQHLSGVERVMLADKLQAMKLPLPLLNYVRHLPGCKAVLVAASVVPTDRTDCDCGLRQVLEAK